ncbi:hypothetical protein V6Z12_D12G163700 [Gossypium hirsutum]
MPTLKLFLNLFSSLCSLLLSPAKFSIRAVCSFSNPSLRCCCCLNLSSNGKTISASQYAKTKLPYSLLYSFSIYMNRLLQVKHV